jgi:hypothetical protein
MRKKTHMVEYTFGPYVPAKTEKERRRCIGTSNSAAADARKHAFVEAAGGGDVSPAR